MKNLKLWFKKMYLKFFQKEKYEKIKKISNVNNMAKLIVLKHMFVPDDLHKTEGATADRMLISIYEKNLLQAVKLAKQIDFPIVGVLTLIGRDWENLDKEQFKEELKETLTDMTELIIPSIRGKDDEKILKEIEGTMEESLFFNYKRILKNIDNMVEDAYKSVNEDETLKNIIKAVKV